MDILKAPMANAIGAFCFSSNLVDLFAYAFSLSQLYCQLPEGAFFLCTFCKKFAPTKKFQKNYKKYVQFSLFLRLNR